MKTLSNVEWGARVGCSHSMASRIRRGLRKPSAALASKIGSEFGIPEKELLRSLAKGPDDFAKLLAKHEKKQAKVAA